MTEGYGLLCGLGELSAAGFQKICWAGTWRVVLVDHFPGSSCWEILEDEQFTTL